MCLAPKYLNCHSLPSSKESRPEIPEQDGFGRLDIWFGSKEVWEVMLKKNIQFPKSLLLQYDGSIGP
jgi:hypothetical protein